MAAAKLSFGAAGRVTRMWTIGGGLGCLLIAVLAWVVLVNPARTHVASLRSDRTSVDFQNSQLQAKLGALEKQRAGIAAQKTALATSREGLPIDSQLPDLTRQLQSQAGQTSVGLRSITAGAPTVAGAASAAATPLTTAATGQIVAIPMTVVSEGSLANQAKFLALVQDAGPRLALVSSVSFSPGAQATTSSIDTSVTMTVQLQVFVTPQSPAAAAALKKQLAGASAN